MCARGCVSGGHGGGGGGTLEKVVRWCTVKE